MLIFVTCLCYYTSCHLYRMSSRAEFVREREYRGEDNANGLDMCEFNYVCK